MSDSQNKVGKKKGKTPVDMDFDSIKVDLENDSSMNLEDDEVGSMDVDDKNDSGVRKPKAKRSRKERSVVWHYFTKRQNKALGGKVPSKCNKCGHVLMFDSKQGSNHVSVNELTEDIMSFDISRESDASNSVNNPKV
ncbi:uncharacterized protein LOC110914514 isoform X2 [Helianthus annuus]|nr:uncharacterized protein LOC110914514 isoform X2 [Helianthus annuus]